MWPRFPELSNSAAGDRSRPLGGSSARGPDVSQALGIWLFLQVNAPREHYYDI